MKYLVCTQGRKGLILFLVDRTKCKRKWWVTNLPLAMIFEKESAAIIQKNKLVYKKPTVVSYEKALKIAKQNAIIEEELEANYNPDDHLHPFSSDALGQW
jgi:hypothetical protein